MITEKRGVLGCLGIEPFRDGLGGLALKGGIQSHV